MYIMTKRNIVTFVLLSIFTCGIYSIYWNYLTACELNEQDSEGPPLMNFFLAFLLGFVTCGIYLLYWEYLFYKKADKVLKTDNSLIYFILAIFGLSIVSDALVQNTINEK